MILAGVHALWFGHAFMPCIHAMYSCHAFIQCIHGMHPFHAFLYPKFMPSINSCIHAMYSRRAFIPCIACHACMHACHASMPCIQAIHSWHAFMSCIHSMHCMPCIPAFMPYIHAMHPYHTFMPCIPAMHCMSCIPAMHCMPCIPAMHSCYTFMPCIHAMHSCHTFMPYIHATDIVNRVLKNSDRCLCARVDRLLREALCLMQLDVDLCNSSPPPSIALCLNVYLEVHSCDLTPPPPPPLIVSRGLLLARAINLEWRTHNDIWSFNLDLEIFVSWPPHLHI